MLPSLQALTCSDVSSTCFSVSQLKDGRHGGAYCSTFDSFDHHASLREKSAMSRSDQLVIAFGFRSYTEIVGSK